MTSVSVVMGIDMVSVRYTKPDNSPLQDAANNGAKTSGDQRVQMTCARCSRGSAPGPRIFVLHGTSARNGGQEATLPGSGEGEKTR